MGKGSYGTVYKVQRVEDGGVYALKETDLGRMGPKERADAVNEIRVLGSMKHPNVVRHHETFVSGRHVSQNSDIECCCTSLVDSSHESITGPIHEQCISSIVKYH